MRKENKGITLIALVITIIVLLILAGVSIATLAGEHGILTQANNAKQRTEDAAKKEQEDLNDLNEYLRNIVGDSESSGGNLPSTGDTEPYLPEGSTVIEGNLSKGVVIRDKNDNEWVWVEVPKSIFITATSNMSYTNIENDMIAYASNYRKSNYMDSYYEGNGTSSEAEYNNLKNKMLSSVYTNGGFWISRYEIGTDTVRTSASDSSAIPVSRQDMYVYNWVTVSQAQELASNMKPTNNQTASILFGIQWDLTLKYIEEKGDKTQSELGGDNESWGNYSNSTFQITRGKYSNDNGTTYTQVSETYTKPNNSSILLTTGVTDRNKVLNIYDLTGNVWEWTIEKGFVDHPSTRRGGAYTDGSNNSSAVYRTCDIMSRSFYHYGFRVTLL